MGEAQAQEARVRLAQPQLAGASRPRSKPNDRKLDDEIFRFGVGDDDGAGRLLGYEVELFGERNADAVDLEQLGDFRLVVEVGARGVAP